LSSATNILKGLIEDIASQACMNRILVGLENERRIASRRHPYQGRYI
jgi:hypothetical protein